MMVIRAYLTQKINCSDNTKANKYTSMGVKIMKTSIIFGLGTAGLFLGRQLSKNCISVIGIGRSDDVGLYSKHIQGYVAETKLEIDKVLNKIIKNESETPKAYICSDQYLTLLLEEYPEVFSMLDFIGCEIDVLELINNKSRISNYCNNIGINTPRTYEYREIINQDNLKFPLIFKLNTKELTISNNPIGKIKIINNSVELSKLMSELDNSSILKDDIMIQTYVQGDNSKQFSYGGFIREGQECAGIIVNQLRQYPQGISSLVVEVIDNNLRKQIMEIVNKFIKTINYSGFLEMEFKVSNGVLYLMDINPRPWGWVSILGEKYTNFNLLFSTSEKTTLNRNENLCIWKSPIRNFISYFKGTNNAKIPKTIKGKCSRKNLAYDIYDPDDIKPVFAIYMVGFQKIIKRIR